MIEMSVIVMTPDRYASIRQTMDYLRAQTVRDRLEILLVTPSADRLELDNTVRGDFGAVRVIEVGQLNSTAEARATAICATTAPIVALTEDHSFPEPMWAEALIQAHRQAWAVVGPTAINANPASATSWANFAIEYAEWMDPAPGGVAAHLPGHNSAYKREVLLQYGDALGQWLDAESVLHWDLRAKGYALYLEPSAKIRHWNFSRLLPSLSLRFDCARLFACARARQWSFFHCLVYIGGAPLIPLVRLFRILRALLRPQRRVNGILRFLPSMLLLLTFAAVGEAVGYAFGDDGVSQRMADLDFHRERFLNHQDRIVYDFVD